MASLAEKRMEDAEDHPVDQTPEVEARPEELRLLEALLSLSRDLATPLSRAETMDAVRTRSILTRGSPAATRPARGRGCPAGGC